MNINNIDYKKKYLKYKTKYLSLKELEGGEGEEKAEAEKEKKYPDRSVININELERIYSKEFKKIYEEIKAKTKAEAEEAEKKAKP